MNKTKFTYNENAKINFKINDLITACLTGLETFLKNLKEDNPDSLTTIINYLSAKYRNEEDFSVSIDKDYDVLKQYPEVLKGSINIVLSLANYSKYKQPSINDEINIDALDIIRTFSQFEYSFMSSILEIMPRKEAIEYIKKLADEIAHSRTDPNNYVSNFEEMLERYRGILERWQAQDVVAGISDDVKLLYKVKKCRWAEVLKDFDHELSYAMMCYQDFENTKNQNPNFILTRTKTIMQGNECCDFCYHDTRMENEIAHPSEKEFQDLG